jgi:ribosomal protein L22
MAEKQRPDEEPEADAATEAAPAPDAEAPEETPAAEAETVEETVSEPVAEASAGDDAESEPEAEAAAQPKPRRSRAKKADKADEDAAEEAEEKPAPKRKAPAKKKPAADKAAEDKPAVEEKPAAKPARPAGQRPVVRAQAKYVRTSARKARLVCDHIRGKSVDEARAILAHTPRAVSQDWSKLLESAVANAEHNHELLGDDLKIHAVFADEGPTIKRYRPRAMGRATPIRKRTSHLTIQLTVKE